MRYDAAICRVKVQDADVAAAYTRMPLRRGAQPPRYAALLRRVIGQHTTAVAC